VSVRPERNLILVKGSIPGSKNSIVIISEAIKWVDKQGRE